jgi:hypothetical protein
MRRSHQCCAGDRCRDLLHLLLRHRNQGLGLNLLLDLLLLDLLLLDLLLLGLLLLDLLLLDLLLLHLLLLDLLLLLDEGLGLHGFGVDSRLCTRGWIDK